MPPEAAVLLRGPGTVYLVADDGRLLARGPLAADPEAAARAITAGPAELPSGLRPAWVRRADAAEPLLARALSAAGPALAVADPARLRAARERLPVPTVDEARRFLIPLARAGVRELLRGPEASLIALAREEARLERALGRELGARAQWVEAPAGVLEEHAREAERFAEQFRRHHNGLERRIESAARGFLPNLSAVVGPKVAARLLAAAGGRARLARVPSARLQLLGARRRPDPERGPRFGVLYRAPGIDELPEDRRGAYARSLAALAAIAVRADEFTGRELGALLVARRDRRLAALRRRR